MRVWKFWCYFVAGLTLGNPALFAQTASAQLEGRILDSSGSVIPDTAITVTNSETGIKRDITSNDRGDYEAPLLPAGNSQITARKEGFKPVTRSGIVLQVGQTARIDF